MGLEGHGVDSRPATLEEETRTVIEEARMVLLGIQAFFGFQLIAVFNSTVSRPHAYGASSSPGCSPDVSRLDRPHHDPGRLPSYRGERNGFTPFR